MKLAKKFCKDAHLVSGASFTYEDEYPIIEKEMVTDFIPEDIIQWDQRSSVKNRDKSNLGISFYCVDGNIMSVVNNPDKYIDELNQYGCIIGMDISPFDDMPLYKQKNHIGINLSTTYYIGTKTKKIIPNVRLGNDRTLSSLSAYPKETVIAIGTSGFIKTIKNRTVFANQMKIVIRELRPTAILVYGVASDIVIEEAIKNNIPVYQYDSYMQKKAKRVKKELVQNER